MEKPTDPIVSNYLFEGWYLEDEKWSFLNNTVDNNKLKINPDVNEVFNNTIN